MPRRAVLSTSKESEAHNLAISRASAPASLAVLSASGLSTFFHSSAVIFLSAVTVRMASLILVMAEKLLEYIVG